MANERCSVGEHDWFCRKSTGTIGEIVVSNRLATDAVKSVLADPTKSEEICPKGVILCNNCEIPLIAGQNLPGATIEFVQDLEKKLEGN